MVVHRILTKPWLLYPLLLAIVIVIVYLVYFCCFYSVTTVILVRHAEVSTMQSQDPPLNAAGQERAQTLVHVAGEADVTVIYATQYNRTQQTVQPLATHLGLPVNLVDAMDIEGIVDQVLSDYSGEIVLIVGHSNTIPQIIEEFGGEPIPPIGEGEFDNMFIVTVITLGKVNVVNLKYGDLS